MRLCPDSPARDKDVGDRGKGQSGAPGSAGRGKDVDVDERGGDLGSAARGKDADEQGEEQPDPWPGSFVARGDAEVHSIRGVNSSVQYDLRDVKMATSLNGSRACCFARRGGRVDLG